MLYVASVFAADSNQCLPINLALFKVSSSVYDHFSNKIVIVKNFDNMNYFYARFKLLFENDMQSVLIIPDLDEQYLKIEKQKKRLCLLEGIYTLKIILVKKISCQIVAT